MRSEHIRFGISTLIFLITFFLVFCPLLHADEKQKLPSIPFSSNLLQAVARSKESGKPLVIAFYAAWCPYCLEMKKTTLNDPELIKTAQKFEWIIIDIDRDISLTHSYGVKAVPQFQIFDPQANLRARFIGKIGAAEFRQHLLAMLDQIKASKDLVAGEPPILIKNELNTEIATSPEAYRAKAICFSHVGYGPLDLPSQSPLQSLRMGLPPRTPSTLSRSQVEGRFRVTWVNIWASEEPDFFFDYEQLQTNIGLAYGLTDTLQFEIAFETRSRFGGEMDSFIQGFHDLFSIDQNGRDEVPKGDFRYDIFPSGTMPGVSLTSSDRGIYSTSLLFTLQHNVTCGTEKLPAIAYAFTLRSEIQNEDLEDGSFLDFGFWLSASRRFSDFYLYGTLGYSVFGREEFRGIELRNDQFAGMAAIEWRFATQASLLVQYLITEGVVDNLGDLSDPSHEITLGAKWEIKSGTVLEFGLVENVVTPGNSPDFGLHFGITSRF